MSALRQALLEHAQTDVTLWRFETLLAAGYTIEDADLLAEQPDVDLHTAVYLIESGCPTDTALRILL